MCVEHVACDQDLTAMAIAMGLEICPSLAVALQLLWTVRVSAEIMETTLASMSAGIVPAGRRVSFLTFPLIVPDGTEGNNARTRFNHDCVEQTPVLLSLSVVSTTTGVSGPVAAAVAARMGSRVGLELC
jgi:hypothetical protein